MSKQSNNESRAENQQERLVQIGWIVGFVDGEGCFSISVFRNRTTRFGWQIFPEFVVTQSEKSLSTLKQIKKYFSCGNIFINRRYDNHKTPIYRYCIRNIADLEKEILPFFEKYKLQSAKQQDFEKFSVVVRMLRSKVHLSKEGFQEIVKITGKSIELESSETTRQAPPTRG